MKKVMSLVYAAFTLAVVPSAEAQWMDTGHANPASGTINSANGIVQTSSTVSNVEYYLAVPHVRMPLDRYRMTSPFGRRRHPVTGRSGFHNGIDLAARAQAVRCIMDGTVTATGYHRHLGNYVRIDHGSVQSLYGHLSSITVTPGLPVTAGYPIGITGRTGRATGEHLHLAIRWNGTYIDPWKFLRNLIENEH